MPAIAHRTLLIALSLLFGFFSVALAAEPPFVVALPNGYYLEKKKGAEINLVKRRGGTVVRGPVAAYGIHRNLIAGAVGQWPPRPSGYPNETPFPENADAKYFILDTTTGQAETDLALAAWKERLKTLGVPETFRIVAPILPGGS
jgi:hypothetical protein